MFLGEMRDISNCHSLRIRHFSSGFAVVMINGKEVEMSDFWPSDDSTPIHLKESSALFNTLLAVQESLRDHRVDAYVFLQVLMYLLRKLKRRQIPIFSLPSG